MKLAARETEGERNAEPELRRRVGTENAGRRIDALCPRRGRSRPVPRSVYRINAIASGSQNPRIEINTPKMIPRAAPSGSSTRVELSTRAYRRENRAAGRTSCVNVCAIVASPSWFDFRFRGSRGPHPGESGRMPFSL